MFSIDNESTIRFRLAFMDCSSFYLPGLSLSWLFCARFGNFDKIDLLDWTNDFNFLL